jgi:hypothetical protein
MTDDMKKKARAALVAAASSRAGKIIKRVDHNCGLKHKSSPCARQPNAHLFVGDCCASFHDIASGCSRWIPANRSSRSWIHAAFSSDLVSDEYCS